MHIIYIPTPSDTTPILLYQLHKIVVAQRNHLIAKLCINPESMLINLFVGNFCRRGACVNVIMPSTTHHPTHIVAFRESQNIDRSYLPKWYSTHQFRPVFWLLMRIYPSQAAWCTTHPLLFLFAKGFPQSFSSPLLASAHLKRLEIKTGKFKLNSFRTHTIYNAKSTTAQGKRNPLAGRPHTSPRGLPGFQLAVGVCKVCLLSASGCVWRGVVDVCVCLVFTCAIMDFNIVMAAWIRKQIWVVQIVSQAKSARERISKNVYIHYTGIYSIQEHTDPPILDVRVCAMTISIACRWVWNTCGGALQRDILAAAAVQYRNEGGYDALRYTNVVSSQIYRFVGLTFRVCEWCITIRCLCVDVYVCIFIFGWINACTNI